MSSAVDVNKLKGLMKTMAQKVGLENIKPRKHSGRKTI